MFRLSIVVNTSSFRPNWMYKRSSLWVLENMTTFIHSFIFPIWIGSFIIHVISWHSQSSRRHVDRFHSLRSWRSGFSWLIPKVPYLYSYSWNHVQLIGELGSLGETIFWFEGFDSKSELCIFCKESLFPLLGLIHCGNHFQHVQLNIYRWFRTTWKTISKENLPVHIMIP